MPVIMKPRRALLLYATMTKNTEKIANWFRETFLHYGWEVTYLRIAANTDWVGCRTSSILRTTTWCVWVPPSWGDHPSRR